MPTYEYVCTKCGHAFDYYQSITQAPLRVCPRERCARKRWGKGQVKRSISAGAGLLFKGSGFYITDYRSEGYKAAAKQESSSASAKPDAAKPDAAKSSPSKPEAKPQDAKHSAPQA